MFWMLLITKIWIWTLSIFVKSQGMAIFYFCVHFYHSSSTTENLAVFLWESLVDKLFPFHLHKIKIAETDKNFVTFKGETMIVKKG
jgi:hypothetical protein